MPVYVDNLHVIVCGTDVSNPALVDLTIGDDVPTDAPVPIAPSGRGAIGWARNAPNPFNPRTRIDYALLAPARVTLEVFDVNGRRLDVLMANTPKPAGQHFVVWDGVDRRGQRAGSGVYYYRIRAGNEFRTGTMHLVK